MVGKQIKEKGKAEKNKLFSFGTFFSGPLWKSDNREAKPSRWTFATCKNVLKFPSASSSSLLALGIVDGRWVGIFREFITSQSFWFWCVWAISCEWGKKTCFISFFHINHRLYLWSNFFPPFPNQWLFSPFFTILNAELIVTSTTFSGPAEICLWWRRMNLASGWVNKKIFVSGIMFSCR